MTALFTIRSMMGDKINNIYYRVRESTVIKEVGGTVAPYLFDG